MPLRPDAPDVTLDLQKAFEAVYDTFRYDLSVDYTRPPLVALEGKLAIWAKELVRERRDKEVAFRHGEN